VLLSSTIWLGCNWHKQAPPREPNTVDIIYHEKQVDEVFDLPLKTDPAPYAFLIVIDTPVTVKHYYAFMDSLLAAYAPRVPYRLTEYIVAHANPWIIDTLVSFDYYARQERGEFINDQKEMTVLRKGEVLLIPKAPQADSINAMLDSTVIDVNIPEFKLRLLVNGAVKYTFPVRVGRNERKYLAMAGREVSLRTPIGEGEIMRIAYNPAFINPADNKLYYATKRDDGKYTQLPLIPWLEPTIDGRRQGSLIHPTTNQATLGRPYSNACVGLPEGAAWIVYYNAPLGTKVRFRYQLDIVNDAGDSVKLKDIYELYEPKK
jgi:L,D-transpeptidase ErfK/SrfK